MVLNQNPSTVPYPFAVGGLHTCIGTFSGQLRCFGDNRYGQLGLGHSYNIGDDAYEMGYYLKFVDLGKDLYVESVDCGMFHTCAILKNNEGAKCWGMNINGQLGLGARGDRGDEPNEMGDFLPKIDLGTGLVPIELALGEVHSCFRFNNGKLKCLGENQFGQLGYEDKTGRGQTSIQMGDNLPFVDLGTNVQVSKISSSPHSNHLCAILSSPMEVAQRIKCWGDNVFYQLGYGDDISRGTHPNQMGNALPLVDLGTESRVKTVSPGRTHTCAITLNDDLKCWGDNFFGQFGFGSEQTISTMGMSLQTIPVDSGNKKIAVVSSGYVNSCFLLDDFVTLKCVGDNSFGQLGQGDTESRGDLPTNMADNIPAINLGTGSLQIKYVEPGMYSVCVGFINNLIKCFGEGYSGQLGGGNKNTIGDEPNEMGSNLPFISMLERNTKQTLREHIQNKIQEQPQNS